MRIEIGENLNGTTVKHIMEGKFTRRDFLKVGLGVLAAGAYACAPRIIRDPIDNLTPVEKPTEFPPTSEPIVTTGTKLLSQEDVLSLPIATTTKGEVIKMQSVFEMFKEDKNLSGLFENPESIEYSAMGITTFEPSHNRMVTFTIFSAVSEEEKKGRLAMVFQPTPEKVLYVLLNRVVDADGKVGLAVTTDINTGEEIEPAIYFSTGLTEKEISEMSDEELKSMDILFYPSGEKIQYKKLYGEVAALNFVPDLSTPTPEETQTPESTSTPESSVKMTLEDWKKVFSGNFTNRWGEVYSWTEMFKKADMLSGQDALERLYAIEKLGGVTNSTSIGILGIDGSITIISELNFAEEQVKKGASILTTKEEIYPPAYFTRWAIFATQEDRRSGNNKITRIRFGEITSTTFPFNAPDSYSIEDFLLVKDMVDIPKHLKVKITGTDEPKSLSEIGITNIDSNNWVVVLNEAGVKNVVIYAQ